MQGNELFLKQYRFRATFVVAIALIILAYRFLTGTLFFGMHNSLFLFTDKETCYNFFLLTHIPQFLISGPVIALAADICMLAFPILFLLTNKRPFIIAFSVLTLFYFLTFNLVTGHHYHSLAGLIVITIPFWFKREEKFDLAWNMSRYYFLYIFATAALWKILRGSAFYPDQLINILKAQQLDLLLQDPDTLRGHIATYLITHAATAHWVMITNVLLQLSFLRGFFTKRFDAVLFWLAIIFCIANYFVMNIISTELLILDLTLMNWGRLERLIGASEKRS